MTSSTLRLSRLGAAAAILIAGLVFPVIGAPTARAQAEEKTIQLNTVSSPDVLAVCATQPAGGEVGGADGAWPVCPGSLFLNPVPLDGDAFSGELGGQWLPAPALNGIGASICNTGVGEAKGTWNPESGELTLTTEIGVGLSFWEGVDATTAPKGACDLATAQCVVSPIPLQLVTATPVPGETQVVVSDEDVAIPGWTGTDVPFELLGLPIPSCDWATNEPISGVVLPPVDQQEVCDQVEAGPAPCTPIIAIIEGAYNVASPSGAAVLALEVGVDTTPTPTPTPTPAAQPIAAQPSFTG